MKAMATDKARKLNPRIAVHISPRWAYTPEGVRVGAPNVGSLTDASADGWLPVLR